MAWEKLNEKFKLQKNFCTNFYAIPGTSLARIIPNARRMDEKHANEKTGLNPYLIGK